jgi:hypothetical protein
VCGVCVCVHRRFVECALGNRLGGRDCSTAAATVPAVVATPSCYFVCTGGRLTVDDALEHPWIVFEGRPRPTNAKDALGTGNVPAHAPVCPLDHLPLPPQSLAACPRPRIVIGVEGRQGARAREGDFFSQRCTVPSWDNHVCFLLRLMNSVPTTVRFLSAAKAHRVGQVGRSNAKPTIARAAGETSPAVVEGTAHVPAAGFGS